MRSMPPAKSQAGSKIPPPAPSLMLGDLDRQRFDAVAEASELSDIFEIVYRRLVLRLGHNQTIGGNCPSPLFG
jgi:hypothetical protein